MAATDTAGCRTDRAHDINQKLPLIALAGLLAAAAAHAEGHGTDSSAAVGYSF